MKDCNFFLRCGGHYWSCSDVIEKQVCFEIETFVDAWDRFDDELMDELMGFPSDTAEESLRDMVYDRRYFLVTIGRYRSKKEHRRCLFPLQILGSNCKEAYRE